MKHSCLFKMLPLIFLITPAILRADDVPQKIPTLEEMSPTQFKEALKKAHAEIEARLGTSNIAESLPEVRAYTKDKAASLAEKRAYETSAQSRINRLDDKIHALENPYKDNFGYAEKDAVRLRAIQSRAQDQLNKIKVTNADSWKANKNALDSLLRQTLDY